MSKTSESWNNLTTTVTTGWNNSAFSVDLSSAKNLDPSAVITNMGSSIYSAASSGWGDILGYAESLGADVRGIFSNTSQYSELGDAAASAALNFLNAKIQKIKDASLAKKTITLGALIGEIAPYATDPLSAGKALADKVGSVIKSTSFSDILQEQGMEFLNSSPELMNAISSLKVVQAYGNTLNIAATTIDVIKKVTEVLEPIIPISEIIADFALTWWSGGTSAAKAGNNLVELTEQALQKLISLTMGALRKLVYNIPISVPALLLGAINSISIKDAVSSYNANPWLASIFSEEYYQQTLNSLNWQKSIDKALRDTMGTVEDWSQFKFDNESDRGNLLKTKFLSSIVQNYMYGSNGNNGIVAKARAEAHIIDFNSPSIGGGKSTGASDIVLTTTSAFVNSGSTNTAPPTAATSNESTLDFILNNDSEENPLVDELSIRLISKKIYDTF